MQLCKYLYHIKSISGKEFAFFIQLIFQCVPIDRENDYFIIMKSPESLYFTNVTRVNRVVYFVICNNAFFRMWS